MDSLVVAINKVLKDGTVGDSKKVERIEAYIEVYIENEQEKEWK